MSVLVVASFEHWTIWGVLAHPLRPGNPVDGWGGILSSLSEYTIAVSLLVGVADGIPEARVPHLEVPLACLAPGRDGPPSLPRASSAGEGSPASEGSSALDTGAGRRGDAACPSCGRRACSALRLRRPPQHQRLPAPRRRERPGARHPPARPRPPAAAVSVYAHPPGDAASAERERATEVTAFPLDGNVIQRFECSRGARAACGWPGAGRGDDRQASGCRSGRSASSGRIAAPKHPGMTRRASLAPERVFELRRASPSRRRPTL